AVEIVGAGDPVNLSIGIWPKALAAGDIDADGLDELVALAEDGTIAICDVDEGSCSLSSLDGVQGLDVTVADVDGDGYAEPVFLVLAGSEREIVVWNLDHDKTAQDEIIAWTFADADLKSIAAGDLDGDGAAEVVILHEGGWWDQADDTLHV